MGSEHTSTGTLVKVWKKENSLKLEKILDSWRRIILMLSRNKLLMKVMTKNSKRVTLLMKMTKNSKRVPTNPATNDILHTHKPRAIALLFSWENEATLIKFLILIFFFFFFFPPKKKKKKKKKS